jgi:hypothetical protein
MLTMLTRKLTVVLAVLTRMRVAVVARLPRPLRQAISVVATAALLTLAYASGIIVVLGFRWTG